MNQINKTFLSSPEWRVEGWERPSCLSSAGPSSSSPPPLRRPSAARVSSSQTPDFCWWQPFCPHCRCSYLLWFWRLSGQRRCPLACCMSRKEKDEFFFTFLFPAPPSQSPVQRCESGSGGDGRCDPWGGLRSLCEARVQGFHWLDLGGRCEQQTGLHTETKRSRRKWKDDRRKIQIKTLTECKLSSVLVPFVVVLQAFVGAAGRRWSEQAVLVGPETQRRRLSRAGVRVQLGGELVGHWGARGQNRSTVEQSWWEIPAGNRTRKKGASMIDSSASDARYYHTWLQVKVCLYLYQNISRTTEWILIKLSESFQSTSSLDSTQFKMANVAN